MGRKHTKNATSGAIAEKAEALDQTHDAEVLDAVEASDAADKPVVDPVQNESEKLSADIAEHVSYWATQIQEINLPRRLWGSRLYRDFVEVKGFKADLKLVYVFLLRLHEKATHWAVDILEQKDVPFTLTIPVGVIQRTFGLTEATAQRYLATLGDGESKKTGENFLGLVHWKKDCKGFQIVTIYDLRVKDVGSFELK